MSKYFSYYFRLIYARLGYDFSKGYNLIPATLGSICYFFMHVIGFSLLISKFTFPTWSKPELWVLFFVFEFYLYLCFHFFIRGLMYTKQEIAQGKFDYHLIKPANIKFLSLIREGSFNNLVAVILGGMFLFVSAVGFHPPLLAVVLFFIFFCVSLLNFHFLSASVISLNFKYGPIDKSQSTLFYFHEVWKYPAESFLSHPISKVLVFPLALATTIPAQFLLSRPVPVPYLYMYAAFTVVCFLLYQLSWHFALRLYSSASS